MRRTIVFLAVVALVAWSGCQNDREEPEDAVVTPGNDNSVTPTDENGDHAGGTTPEQGLAELARFDSQQELEDYFKDQIAAQNSRFEGYRTGDAVDIGVEPIMDEDAGAGDSDAAAPPPTGAEGEGEGEGEGEAAADQDDDFSQTTIQEEGVDEADVVKTDGDYIYVMTGEELRIVQATPPAELQLLSTFSLEGYGRDLYLVGDLAVALTESHGVFHPVGIDMVAVDADSTEPAVAEDQTDTEPPSAEDESGDNDNVEAEPLPDVAVLPPPGEWYRPRPQTIVTIIDLSNRSAPVQASQTVFDGTIAASRMIDGVLRLVLANQPDYYYDILPLGAPEEELALAEIDLDALLPDVQTTDQTGQVTRANVVEWDAFFRPADPDGFGVTTVITLDTAAPEDFDAVAILADPGLIYASTEALYLTDTEWYYDFRRTETDIYKFAFLPDSVALVASGTVPGRILNQYSMGEYQGYLRVATTTDGMWFWETGEEIPSSNGVYVLGEEDGSLAVVGQIDDLAVTEEIRSARFIGTRGYVVTFRRIDPLFTLDLRDPEKPTVVGELKVPGFSTFIVPMDEDHLLTVGEYVDPDGWGDAEGVQLSIFDVSDFAHPQLTAKIPNVVIGDWNTYSEATGNPKAFTYFASQDLLALPIEHRGRDWWWDEGDSDVVGGDGGEAVPMQTPTPPFADGDEFQGIFVYRVTTEDGFDYLGRLSTSIEDDDGWWWTSFTRGVFIGDHVYAATDQVVVTAPLADLTSVTASVELPNEDDYPRPGYPEEPTTAPEPDDQDDTATANGTEAD